MEIRTLRASELDQAFDLDKDAFHQAEARRDFFRRFVDPARMLAAFEGGRLLATSGAIQFGQYFGGRSVPMAGLSSVAVVPDARGRGLAKQVIQACIEAMRERGEVLSSLFPATTSLYRSLGWELGGNFAIRKVLPEKLRGLPRPERGRTRPFDEADWEGIRGCYDAIAIRTNGCVDRPPHWWARCEHRWQQRDFYVFEGESGAIEGYLVYRKRDGEWSDLGGDFGIAVEEIVPGTRDAGLGLWGLLGSWGSQVDQIIFHGGADDPILLLLPEQVFESLAELRWMTRVVDARGAVAARGFPAGLDVEIPFELRDDGVPENSGRHVLTVQKGRGQLAEATSGGGPVLDVRGFSSLYTGWAGIGALERAGLLIGGSADERAALEAAFAGATPWMLDEF